MNGGPRRLTSLEASARQIRVTPPKRKLDIGAQQGPRLAAVVDQQGRLSAARQRLDRQSARAGEEIDDACALDRVLETASEDIEDRFAQPLGGRANFARGGALRTSPSNVRRRCAWLRSAEAGRFPPEPPDGLPPACRSPSRRVQAGPAAEGFRPLAGTFRNGLPSRGGLPSRAGPASRLPEKSRLPAYSRLGPQRSGRASRAFRVRRPRRILSRRQDGRLAHAGAPSRFSANSRLPHIRVSAQRRPAGPRAERRRRASARA